MRFQSDNTSAIAPEIMAALANANVDFAPAYGADADSQRVDAALSHYFGAPVRAFVVTSGTAANALALATLCPPYGAIYTHRYSHIVRDECGAVEAMSHGARLVLLDGPGGKFDAATLRRAVADHPANVHTPQPSAISVTQCTELGRCYQPEELRALSATAHELGLAVHMDGARFANAVAHLGCAPADISARAGIDVLSFGATKNGALGAEAIVFFDTQRVRDLELRRKRGGHLWSKMRYVSAQLLAYVESGVAERNAARANALAQQLGRAAGSRLTQPVESNAVFLRLSDSDAAQLRSQGFGFYEWGAADSHEYRFVVSWNQPDADVEALSTALKSLA